MALNIFSHTAQSYSEAIYAALGKGKQHALIIYKQWFSKGECSPDHPHFQNAQALYHQIVSLTDFEMLPFVRHGDEEQTEKSLLKTEDGYEIEMVSLPMPAGWTLCISSQMGCRKGCRFCETGKMGLLRQLTVREIVAQVFQAQFLLKRPIRNLVFMGMGEPLDNFEAVMQAISILTDMRGFGLGLRHITLSTSGEVEKIYRLIDEAPPSLNLAVSVNAPNDLIRTRLMPINRKYNMAALKEVMQAYCAHPRRKILVEYVLIKGINDRLEDALELAEYLQGLKVTVNLIPYNPQRNSRFEAPDPINVTLFSQGLHKEGYRVTLRNTRGQKIMASCGQLGNQPDRLKNSLEFSRLRDMVC